MIELGLLVQSFSPSQSNAVSKCFFGTCSIRKQVGGEMRGHVDGAATTNRA